LRYTTVEPDGTGSPEGGGPREPCGGPVSAGTSEGVVVEVGEGVSLGEGEEAGEPVVVGVGVDAATTRLDRPGVPPWKTAEPVNPRISATTITATSAMSPRVS
jgi:hypothetical protein